MNVGIITKWCRGERISLPIYYTAYLPAPKFLEWLKKEVADLPNYGYGQLLEWIKVGHLQEQAELNLVPLLGPVYVYIEVCPSLFLESVNTDSPSVIEITKKTLSL